MSCNNEKCECDNRDLTVLIESVRNLEAMLESLKEIIDDNHEETLESIRDTAEGGRGYSTFTED